MDLKRISNEAISGSLEKATRYRLLNEPREAQSICLDILEVDPDNQEAVVTLLLSLTDQFGLKLGARKEQAEELLPRIENEYERVYYKGIILERWAKSQLAGAWGIPSRGRPSWPRPASEWRSSSSTSSDCRGRGWPSVRSSLFRCGCGTKGVPRRAS